MVYKTTKRFLEAIIKKSLLVSVLSVLTISFVLGGCSNKSIDSDYLITINDENIVVSQDEWIFGGDSVESLYTKNYSAVTIKDGEMFEQIVTVFLNKMTDDRRSGEQISDSEYIEAFVLYPNSVTLQIRVDKGDYWVMSRQTYEIRTDYPEETDLSFDELQYILIDAPYVFDQSIQSQIDNTRYVLNNDF
jgi:hypothetical protein